MRSSASAILLVAACNQVLGSREVQETPPGVFDAPLDAPFTCPPIGTTPRFAPGVHQHLAKDCSYYATANGHAFAECLVTSSMTQIFEAPIGEDLVPVPGIPGALATAPFRPRVSADGQLMLITVGSNVGELDRTGDGWTPSSTTSLTVASTPPVYSSIAGDRVIGADYPSQELAEYVRAEPAWLRQAGQPWSELGFQRGPISLSLTGDGLRLLITTTDATLYTDRPSIGAPFRVADLLDVPVGPDLFMTDDCARIYVSGLGSIFYAQQR